MKTLQIVGDSRFGGATYLLIEWCKYLISKGWSVFVLTTDPKTKAKLLEIPDIKIVDHIYIPRNISLSKDLRAFFQLIRFLKKNRFDVVHTYTATPSVLGRLASKCSRVEKIYHHQAAWTIFESDRIIVKLLYKFIEYLAVSWSSKSICVSKAVYNQATDHNLAPREKLTTICNGIDVKGYSQIQIKKGFEKRVRIGSTGRLAKLKDIESIIQAVALLHQMDQTHEYSIELAGEGEEFENLKAYAIDLGLQDFVHFHGFVVDVPGFLETIDIFISTSLREGLSISILEAMAAGKPIVATNIMPNQELIEHEQTGLLVEPHAPVQIAEAVLRFLDDPKLARTCGQNARERVLESYTLERMFSETFQLYQ